MWVSWLLEPPETRIFVQLLVQASIKWNIKALHYWSFAWGIRRWPVESLHKGLVLRTFDVANHYFNKRVVHWHNHTSSWLAHTQSRDIHFVFSNSPLLCSVVDGMGCFSISANDDVMTWKPFLHYWLKKASSFGDSFDIRLGKLLNKQSTTGHLRRHNAHVLLR